MLQFDNLFLKHQQRLMYLLVFGICYWLFLHCTELISSCNSVNLEVKEGWETLEVILSLTVAVCTLVMRPLR